MRITETSLRALIRNLLVEIVDDDEEGAIDKLPAWQPPWAGGGGGSGGHAGDRHWADNEYDQDEFGIDEADEADEAEGDDK
jgi:hypothetical protein